MKIYLASVSPRRKSLLRKAGIKIQVIEPDYEEKNNARLSPLALTKKHALGKAFSAAHKIKQGILISADTVVYLNGKILGKPKNRRHALKMLLNLCGKWHQVVTGVVLLKIENGKIRKKIVFSETSSVYLNSLNNNEIQKYFKQVNPLDKAGAYAAQSDHFGLVREIRGSFTNVVGLPMEKLKNKLDVLK